MVLLYNYIKKLWKFQCISETYDSKVNRRPFLCLLRIQYCFFHPPASAIFISIAFHKRYENINLSMLRNNYTFAFENDVNLCLIYFHKRLPFCYYRFGLLIFRGWCRLRCGIWILWATLLRWHFLRSRGIRVWTWDLCRILHYIWCIKHLRDSHANTRELRQTVFDLRGAERRRCSHHLK